MTRTLFALSLASLAACTTSAGRPPSAAGAATTPVLPSPGVVDPATALALAASGVRVVDVRTPQEFAAGHLDGAVNVPYDELGRRTAEVGPPGAPVVVYCRSGHRSGIAAETLRQLGYTKVYDARRFDALAAAAQAQARSSGPSSGAGGAQ